MDLLFLILGLPLPAFYQRRAAAPLKLAAPRQFLDFGLDIGTFLGAQVEALVKLGIAPGPGIVPRLPGSRQFRHVSASVLDGDRRTLTQVRNPGEHARTQVLRALA